MLSMFFPLSVICLGKLIWEKHGPKLFSSRHQSSSSLSEMDGLSMQNQQQTNNTGNDHGTPDSHNTTQLSSENNGEISRIRAKPEKRNHLLSHWSQNPPSTLGMSDYHGQFDVDDSNVIESNDAVNAQKAKPHSLFGIIPLQTPPHIYAIIAFFDVYANYTTILAFKYTTITSVSLFDALAIPSAMIVSRCFFARRYTKIHFIGVLFCSIGIGLNIMSDWKEDAHLKEESTDEESAQEQLIEADYPHKIVGDVLAITGGILFGIANTLQEVSVKNSTVTEYLGCMTFFASIISFIQMLILERDDIHDFFSQSTSETCSESKAVTLFFLFSIGGVMSYTGIGTFLQISDATFLNLSLLTGDAWAVAFSVFGEGIKPPPAFYIALAITISGVIIYETAPSPVVDFEEEEVDAGELQLTETAGGSTGREELNLLT